MRAFEEVLIKIRDLDRSIVAHQESIRIHILNLENEYRERAQLQSRYLDLLREANERSVAKDEQR